VAIDYDRMQRTFPVHKRRLTVALKTGNPEAVKNACRSAVQEWDEIGAWPDDWSRWQRALDDTHELFNAPRLEEL
jgi:hypothetical protein